MDTKITEEQRFWLERDFVLTLLKQLPSYIFWKNTAGVYLGCNNAFAQSIGISSPEEIIGKTDYDLPTTREASDKFRADDKRIIESKTARLNFEEQQTFPNGKKVILLTSKVPLFDKENKVVGILGIYSDITKQKEEEAELHQAKEAAEIANMLKTKFIVNMSHDIKTPLSGIIGITSMLAEMTKKEEAHQYALMARTSGQRLLDLLNDILEVIAVDNMQEDDLHQQTFDLQKSIHNICDLVLPAIKNKHLELYLDIDPQVPTSVISDRIKIERILLNLLSNAVKFTEKGRVAVRVALGQKKGRNVNIEFNISDTGVGIEEEKIPYIFDRFFRISASPDGEYPGHGIGLYIVKHFIRLLNGDIAVNSTLGEGTSFRFNLPISLSAEKTHKKTTAKPASLASHQDASLLSLHALKPCSVANLASLPKKAGALKKDHKILLIEDDAIVYKITESLLKKMGYQVLGATSAEAALRLLKTQPVDLILTDIGLPGLNGNQLAAVIRYEEKIHPKTAIPIIAITAHVSGNEQNDCLAAGVNLVLAKPLDEEKMKRLLDDFFQTTQDSAP